MWTTANATCSCPFAIVHLLLSTFVHPLMAQKNHEAALPMTKNAPILQDLLFFLNKAPTAWHAVDHMMQKLLKAGFEVLNETMAWKLKAGGRYAVTRNGSTLAAFILPSNPPVSAQVAGSHTDSPAFKLKPNPEFIKENMVMLALEIYGGPLLSSWLNRDLGIGGRVLFTDAKGEVCEQIVSLDQHPVVIPQLAIHLDRHVNENGLILNKQEHLAALAALDIPTHTKDKKTHYFTTLLKEKIGAHTLLAHDLFLYPLEPARFIGFNQQMIASYRIDSLGSVHAILHSFLQDIKPAKDQMKMVVFWDNEEVGSETAQGAASPFLSQTIERICLSLGLERESYMRLITQSLCLSVDLAHALHPNYPEKHDPHHQILLNKGIVIKSNAQNRYASNACSTAIVAELCERLKIPYQKFVSRNDIPCGTTIGPIHAHSTGMPTVDIGAPQLSMHSCREIASCQDHLEMCRLLSAFWQEERSKETKKTKKT